MKNLNIANTIFNGFNDKHCLMLCGYEWGFSKASEALGDDGPVKAGVPHVFSNKALEYGWVAKTWPYDNKIMEWFALWGHPLNQEGSGGNFEKCLVQTNWCDSQNHHIDGSYDDKLLAPEQVDNFIAHVQALQPRIILFFGSRILPLLQHQSVLSRFEAVVGPKLGAPTFVSKPFSGRRFKVGFQDFELARIVCLPHPSGSHGLSYDYIALFSDEIGSVIREYKAFKSINNQ
ncbi:MAG: hypothetical protein QM749_07750 [Aquabacterium sp.]